MTPSELITILSSMLHPCRQNPVKAHWTGSLGTMSDKSQDAGPILFNAFDANQLILRIESRTGLGVLRPEICSSRDRKSTRLNSSHVAISYAVFCLKKKSTPWH